MLTVGALTPRMLTPREAESESTVPPVRVADTLATSAVDGMIS